MQKSADAGLFKQIANVVARNAVRPKPYIHSRIQHRAQPRPPMPELSIRLRTVRHAASALAYQTKIVIIGANAMDEQRRDRKDLALVEIPYDRATRRLPMDAPCAKLIGKRAASFTHEILLGLR